MTSGTAATTFFDNFSSLSLWNGTSGTWATNYWYNTLTGNGGSLPSNGEQEWYINSNDPATSSVVPWTQSNGILTITANPASSSIQPLIDNYQYTSGELNTYHSFSQTYGYFEMRAELPAGQGLWPAFWMLPENGSWPPEIDIMEQLGSNPSVYYTSVHSGTSSAEVNAGGTDNVVNTSTSYNEYAVSWTPTTLTYYFNGKEVYQTPTPSDMNVPMYLELNLAVGGGWPGDANSTTPFPAQMKVAYVDAYASDPSGNLPTETFTANNTAGQLLLGAAGNDVFYAGTNSVIMTGDGATNTYIYTALPTSAGQITDFDPAVDSINLSGLLSSVGYTGTSPFTDGTLSLVSDGNGGTDVEYKASAGSAAKVIVDLDNVAPSAIITSTDFILTGSASSSSSSGSGSSSSGSSGGSTGTTTSTPGVTLTANNTAGQILTATTPNDTFQAGQNSVVMTGDGGSNTYVFTALPWNAGQITNFNAASDKIDVSGLLKAAGYTGTNPFGDGTLTLGTDGHGGTDLFYHQSATSIPITIVDLDNVLPSTANIGADIITTAGTTTSTSSSGTGSGGTTGTTTSTPGVTLTANNTAGQVLTATTPNDIFMAGQNSVVMTGDGGSNTYEFTAQPWNAGQITNFNPASDKINISALLSSAGYTGTNPFGDGTLTLSSDGHGGTDLYYHQTATSIPITIVDIDNVLTSALVVGSDFITGVTGTSTASTGTSASDPTLTANNTAGEILAATSPNTTFIAGSNSVVMTGDGGANVYEFNSQPWNAGQITNFNTATDKIDVAGLLSAAAYTGTNPFGDGTLTLSSDGHGGTDLFYHASSTSVPITIVDIDNVAPSALNTSSDFIISGSSSTGSGTTTTAETLTGNNTAGQVLTATSPSATFIAGSNSVVMTGDGGSNVYEFNSQPWNAGQITNFHPATDKIDVAGLLSAAGYTGTNPFGDGALTLSSDGHGGTDLFYHASSTSVPITVVDIDNVAPSALNTSTDFIISGSSTGSTTATTTGVTLTANDTPGQVLTGTPGNDTFHAGHNSVIMTGDGGSDTFVFDYQPWNAGQITDFNPAADTINLHGLLSAADYTGTNPFDDGTLSLSSDGNGGTDLYYHASATSIPIKIVDLDHVSASSINTTTDFILH